jgi:hypothetical protein
MCRKEESTTMTVRLSSELPDDAGTVFVTNVPDAPFQILGRRHNGELFVGACFQEGPGAPSLDTCRELDGVEIVTGAEGEKLIAAMVHLGVRQMH